MCEGIHIRCQYSGNDPSFAPKPGPSVYGTHLFLACLSLDLDLIVISSHCGDHSPDRTLPVSLSNLSALSCTGR